MERLGKIVIESFFTVYNSLNYGYLEQVYVGALCVELRRRAVRCDRERLLEVRYRGEVVGHYRADMLVEDSLLVEAKAGRALDQSARWQTLNYLRATGVSLGLLLHFGPKPSFQRVVL